jgi:hypothetical protein
MTRQDKGGLVGEGSGVGLGYMSVKEVKNVGRRESHGSVRAWLVKEIDETRD